MVTLALALNLLALQNPTPIDPQMALRYFKQAKALSDSDGGRTWGVRLYGPMMFADRATREVVANGPDKEGRLKAEGSVWVGKLDEKDTVANTAVNWGGVRFTMVMWPLPEQERPRGKLMMHECFHRIQDGLGLPGRDAQLPHLDGKDGRIWLRLEMRALSVALDAQGENRRRAAKDALLFRAMRRSLCSPEATKGEQMLELNEGLAQYTGFRLSGYPVADLPDRAAVDLDNADLSTSLARSFAYDTGPGYGFLLDAYSPSWRKRLNAESDLSDLLATALHFSIPPSNIVGETNESIPSDLAGRANERAMAYEGDIVMAEETRRAERRAQLTKTYMKRFVDGPVLILPAMSSFNYSYDPNAVDSLDGYGTVYLGGRFTDDWGVLSVDDPGVLVIRKSSVEARVPAPSTPGGLSGDGWTLTLNPGWKLVPGTRSGDWTVAKG